MTAPTTLVLGPVLRHVDESTAAVWVQTSAAAHVTVELIAERGGRRRGRGPWTAPTFAVHGHHYALVEVADLPPGRTAYRVLLDGAQVWPEPGSTFPPSTIAPVPADQSPHLAFGSCRTSVPHDAEHHASHGVDALRAFALALAEGGEHVAWPALLLLLGDQVYADDTSEAMREFISSRRSLDEPPGEELRDFDEYAHLYLLAWSDPALRWLLSSLPSLMIFDDHDVRDDWNTSVQWRADLEATSWWHGRIVAALGSYWVYQHLGNLSPQDRERDDLWRELTQRRQRTNGEVDLTDVVDAFGDRVDRQPDAYRWSYRRDLGGSRLVVVDSRAARVLEPGRRSMLDDAEMDWLDAQLQGGFDHVFVGTSLPFLLPPGLHYLEQWNEALVDGAWGRRAARVGERLRTTFDLEHWGAFHEAFDRVLGMVGEVADGRRGPVPTTVTFLSGDVHHSYASEVRRTGGSRVLQLVCSPIRNPLPRHIRVFTALLAHGLARPMGHLVRTSDKVPDAPAEWETLAGPWYDNNLALLQVTDEHLDVTWVGGEVVAGDHTRPVLRTVSQVRLDPVGGPGPAAEVHGRAAGRRLPGRRRRRHRSGAAQGAAPGSSRRAAR